MAQMPQSSITKITIKVIEMMQMYNPPHPGEIIKELCLEPLGLTITRAAEALGVSRKTLSAILNGRAGISPEMAIRLSLAFDTSAESWLNQQIQYDLWLARQNQQALKVERLVAV
jgi:antitoxin HigA-1